MRESDGYADSTFFSFLPYVKLSHRRPMDTPQPVRKKWEKSQLACEGCGSSPIDAAALPSTEEEWRRKLAPEQFEILRQRGTEPPYSGAYLHHKRNGLYACAGCGQPLYDSRTKYDACGWPSFWDALPGSVATREDRGSVEAVCTRCEGHLGHIFDDGPPPTGKRH